ncbi:MAG TPA: class I SAM-dependent methyltransferase [Acidimicrobiales bacterium]|nr:class I SAM-dependent methyltransferase [Acidimicrobiales bacterium]
MNEGHLQFCASEEWRQMIEATILPEALAGIDLGPEVVEIGPGPGLTTDVLRRLADHLTAVEFDPELAEALAKRLSGTNVTVLRGDATALELRDGRFSGAACFHMLHHVPTGEAQDRIFSELARVLQPGGRLVAADGVWSEERDLFHEGDVFNPIDPSGLEARLSAAGFGDIELRTYDLGWITTAVSAR